MKKLYRVCWFGWLSLGLSGWAHGAGEATPVSAIRVPEGFQIERLYSVPKDSQGSWVAMTVDGKGRLIVSDQYGGLFRMTPPGPGKTLAPEQVERIDLDIGGAQGLLWAFDRLYVVLNTKEHGGRGLYSLHDTNGDDQYDTKKLLKKFAEEGTEHGPHAVIAGPDGKSIYVVVGNQTSIPDGMDSRVPRSWGEDILLPRIYGRGFMKGVLAPRGWIGKTDPDGKDWELIATGFRNPYDIAFNGDGELFTYDADMEWDMNTPWYRPTRINHVISGSEFGWRNGSAKWPDYYSDSFGAVVNVGPGSPTGVAFGYGAAFPEKYQKAFYALDWSYGKLYAVHLQEDGASYQGEVEEFISAQPLPLTDILIHPKDRAMYFTVGGRRVQSGLYRVTHRDGGAAVDGRSAHVSEAVQQRRKLESFHGRKDPVAVATAWPYLGSSDRALRYAARVAVEHQPVGEWADKALSEAQPDASLAALMALARHGDASTQAMVVERLARFDVARLNRQQRLDLIRASTLAFVRLGAPNDSQKQSILQQWAAHFPGKDPVVTAEAAQLVVYLESPKAAAQLVALLEAAPSQEEQIHYAKTLRFVSQGWTQELQERYFSWFARAKNFQGGASFTQFMDEIRKEAVAKLSDAEKTALESVLNKKVEADTPSFSAKPRSFVKAWTLPELEPFVAKGIAGGRNFENGRGIYGAVGCAACHRLNQTGGAIGPDLTSARGKFSARDLLEQIVEPNKEISDQYGAMVFTLKNGSQIIGRIMNLRDDIYQVNTNMFAPGVSTSIKVGDVKDIRPSEISMMPPGLLNTLTPEDVQDLLAYVLSAGDPENAWFKP